MGAAWRGAVCIVLVLFVVGNAGRSAIGGDDDRWVRDVGRKLDRVGRALDKYGSVTLSAPLFTVPDSRFEFGLNRSAEDYYKEARTDISAAAAVFSQRARENRVGFQASANLQDLLSNQILMLQFRDDMQRFYAGRGMQDAGTFLKLMLPVIDPELAAAIEAAEALEAAAAEGEGEGDTGEGTDEATDGDDADEDTGEVEAPEELTEEQKRVARARALLKTLTEGGESISPESRPAIPEFRNNPPTFDPATIPDADLAKRVIAGEQFKEFLALLDNSAELKIPNRSAVITAAGDRTVQAMLNFLGKPELAPKFKDKLVLFGVSTVSVNPGYDTAEGYVADVSAEIGYEYLPLRADLRAALEKANDPQVSELAKYPPTSATPPTMSPAPTRKHIGLPPGSHPRANAGNSRHSMRHTGGSPAVGMIRGDGEQHMRSESGPSLGVILEETASQVSRGISTSGVSAPFELADKNNDGFFDELYELNGAPVPTGTSPLVAAVSPMTEVQALDLASSIRTQQAFALRIALALTGFGAQAQAGQLLQEVDRLEQDVRSRTALNTVASYSSGGIFGYQIGPSVTALTSTVNGGRVGGPLDRLGDLLLGRKRPGPGNVLQRQTFPVLVIVGLDANDLRIKRQRVLDKEGNVVGWNLFEPHIRFRQNLRWKPAAPAPGEWRKPRISESEHMHLARHLNDAEKMVHESGKKSSERAAQGLPSDSAWLRTVAGDRISKLSTATVGSYTSQAIPISLFLERPQYDEPKARAVTIVPNEITAGESQIVTVVGENFDKSKPQGVVVPTGAPLTAELLANTAGTATLKLTPEAGLKAPRIANLQLDLGGDRRLPLPPILLLPAKQPPKPDPKNFQIKIEHDPATKNTTWTIPSDVPFEVLKLLLEKQHAEQKQSQKKSEEAKVDLDLRLEAESEKAESD